MDIQRIIAELHQERERIERAILALEQVASGKKCRGRPPNWMRKAKTETVKTTQHHSKKPVPQP